MCPLLGVKRTSDLIRLGPSWNELPDAFQVRQLRTIHFFTKAHLLWSSGCTASFAAMVLRTL